MADETDTEDDVKAISTVLGALKPLGPEDRMRVLQYVVQKLGITLSGQSPSPARKPDISAAERHEPPPAHTHHGERHAATTDVQDIRSLAADKKPRTVNEKVALVAYYISHVAPEGERRDFIVADDLKPYFIQADFELPTAPPAMTLIHAKNAGYLNVAERGQYKLNAVGHNLVAHKLPSGEGGEPRRRSARKPAKAKAKGRKKKGGR